MTSTTPFPLFSDWLAAQPDSFVGDVLHNRPDTLSPPPKSSQVLAARLKLRASVTRALTKLATLELACIEAAADLGADASPISAAALISHIHEALARANVPQTRRPTVAHIRASLDVLRRFGLIWGDGPGPHGAFSGKSSRRNPLDWQDYFCLIDEASAGLPPGWHLLPDPARPSHGELRHALSSVSKRQQQLLDTLADSGGLGITKDAHPSADPALPVPSLIQAGLLERIDERTVRLPVTVRALMRGAPLADDDVSLRPASPATHTIASGNDRAAAAAWEALRQDTELLKYLGASPTSTLKSGTIGVRETRSLVGELGVEISELARSVSHVMAAGLAQLGTPHPLPLHDTGNDYLAPTLAADGFLSADVVDRWVCMIVGTRASDAAPWRVDQSLDGTKRLALLDPATRVSGVPALRRMVLDACALAASPKSAQSNTGESAPGDVVVLDDLRECAAYYFPIENARASDEMLTGVVTELEALGIIVRDPTADTISVGLSKVGEALIELIQSGTAIAFDNLRAACSELLPPNATYLMVQADNTVVVPGPASPEMERMLNSIAELESPGLASIYRITEDSLQDALDAGLSAEEISEFLDTFALGEVPQSVIYLLDDVARRHGRLRGGPAASFVRCDDPALLAALLTSPAGQGLALRKIAETVLISQAPLVQVIEAARTGGFSIIAEDAEGLVLDLERAPSRIEAPGKKPVEQAHIPEPERISLALELIAKGDLETPEDEGAGTTAIVRSGDASGSRTVGASGQFPTTDSDTTALTSQSENSHEDFRLLQRAARRGEDLMLSFADRNGKLRRRRVRPVTVSGGQVDAIEPATGQVLRFPLHRITEVNQID